MSKIQGRFQLRLTSNGNLTGEFSNHSGTRIYTESADRDWKKNPPSSPPYSFDGTYDSSWMDPEHVSSAKLEIDSQNSPGRIFELEWKSTSKGEDFKGQGMIAEGLLIGNYESA